MLKAGCPSLLSSVMMKNLDFLLDLVGNPDWEIERMFQEILESGEINRFGFSRCPKIPPKLVVETR